MKWLLEQAKSETTLAGFVKPSRKTWQIYETLSKHDPEWEKLVAMLRKVAGSKTVVDQLWRAFENDGLVNEAREILPQTVAANQKKKKTAPNRLKRLYWCYIRKA